MPAALPSSQRTPQHQSQQFALVLVDDHVVQHVLHYSIIKDCQPLHDCMVQVCVHPVVWVHKQPAPHR